MNEAAAIVAATAVIRRNRRPDLAVDAIVPGVELAVPIALAVAHHHAFIDTHVVGFGLGKKRRLLLVLVRQPFIKALEADVAAAPFGQGEGKVEVCIRLEIGKVAKRHLLLQRHGCGTDDDAFLQRLRKRNRGDAIGRRLTSAGTGFHHTQSIPLARQHPCDVRDHFALATARFEASGLEPRTIGFLNLLFDGVA